MKHFGTKINGTFLEMGAVNGVAMSNTLHFESDFRWTGVLIEANPDMYKHLIYNRPGATTVHAAVCDKEQEVHYSRSSAVGMRGILEFMKEEHIERWLYRNNEQKQAVWNAALKMMCLPLSTIFATIGYPDTNGVWVVDWFSLDVEGAELEVLSGINFENFLFKVITVEAIGNGPKDTAVARLLSRHGYEKHGSDGINNWFVKS